MSDLRLKVAVEPSRSNADAFLWLSDRPYMWIFRVVWDRDWMRRPEGWRPFRRDPGGYHKRRVGRWMGHPIADWALGRFAAIAYRVDHTHEPRKVDGRWRAGG